MSDYKSTLNLPETSFPMKANLANKEPETLKQWEEINVYGEMINSNQGSPTYCLHDGPPYANGHIHLGTAMNKIIKDIIIKARNMQGYLAEYVPGWDCHGLPIEHKVAQELQAKGKVLPPIAVRKICREYANKYLDIQRNEFKRLGAFGDWEDPYITMKPEYESITTKELVNFIRTGSVVRNKKPIYWCASCQTALAEAEVEYHDHHSDSIFVRFPLNDPAVAKLFPQADLSKTFALIWTTTPWTLPSNLAIMVNPEFEYVLMNVSGNFYIVAEEMLDDLREPLGWQNAEVVASVKGSELEGLKARHPFYDRESLVILADCVTLDAGTGLVHSAPGHGPDDYAAGMKYGLEVYSPVNDQGVYLDEVEFFAGMQVFDANPKVVAKLEEVGNLLAKNKISHSYPHCWRCKNPVIYRATTQWFILMDNNDLRKKTLSAIRDDVEWIPGWGADRIYNMVENRPDWCISRQRVWGVPIIALICESCDTAWNDADWAEAIANKYAEHPTGCDYWYETDVSELTPPGLTCPKCGAAKWRKDNDILDVWFDSGASFSAVCEQRKECKFPADLYLEGSDQHRGWFQSSLLISMANRGIAPYKAVLTHGYVVDGEGKKMSKSVGNVVAPHEVIDKFGAEILRMWVSSVEYREDVRISDEIISRMVDAYRRLRNTCRYLLGNLSDFSKAGMLPDDQLDDLDRFALHLAAEAHHKVQEGYASFEFHKAFHTLHNFCASDLSSFYLDIIKDRLYVSGRNSKARRSAQTAMYRILMQLITDMAPILSFTAEEVMSHLPAGLRAEEKTVFALKARQPEFKLAEAELPTWKMLQTIREEVTSAIEPLRKEGVVGHALDTRVTIYGNADILDKLNSLKTEHRALFIVSQLILAPLAEAPQDASRSEKLEGLAIGVEHAKGDKCERCWVYCEKLGEVAEYPTICPYCANILING